MPRKDLFHDACKSALIKSGWTITHDPYAIQRGRQTLYVDLGAEQFIAAQREDRKIAVEVKSLLATIDMAELERALGQYVLYRSLIKRRENDRTLYLAVTNEAHLEYFDPAEGRDLVQDELLKLIVFDPLKEEILQWID